MYENYALAGNIETIKLVRNMSGFGLKDCKVIVDFWKDAFQNGGVSSDARELQALGKIVRKIHDGEWIINGMEIMRNVPSPVVLRRDILDL